MSLACSGSQTKYAVMCVCVCRGGEGGSYALSCELYPSMCVCVCVCVIVCRHFTVAFCVCVVCVVFGGYLCH